MNEHNLDDLFGKPAPEGGSAPQPLTRYSVEMDGSAYNGYGVPHPYGPWVKFSEVEALKQAALRILSTQSGDDLLDACRQVKQIAISEADNSEKLEATVATLTRERDALKQFMQDDERNVGKIVDALADAELEVCPTHTEAVFVCPDCYDIERAGQASGAGGGVSVAVAEALQRTRDYLSQKGLSVKDVIHETRYDRARRDAFVEARRCLDAEFRKSEELMAGQGGGVSPATCQHLWRYDIGRDAMVCANCGEAVSEVEARRRK